MSKYILAHGQFYDISDDELCHYGVRGMRWGIRRATKQLQKATSNEQRDKAIASLNKHRDKASKQVNKLSIKRPKLEKAYTKAITKIDPKIAKLEKKKYKLTKKSGSIFTSDKKATKLAEKANAMDLKIQGLKAKSDVAKAKMAKNDHMTSLFKQGVSDIDSALASVGKKYINA